MPSGAFSHALHDETKDFYRIFQKFSQKSTFHAKMSHICVTGHPSWTDSFKVFSASSEAIRMSDVTS